MSKYDINYFINLVEGLEEEQFIGGRMGEKGCHCMLGHLGKKQADRWVHNNRTAALTNLMDTSNKVKRGQSFNNDNVVLEFNDSLTEGTMKQSWLQKLNSLKK